MMRSFLSIDRLIYTAKLIVLTLILKSVLISCIRIHENTNQNIIFKVEVENCKTFINLKLSDLIDSCWIVPLETTNESVLGNYFRYIYITNDYIIVDDNNGIYLFTEEGKFINKIISIGRGPWELSISHSFYYYKKKDLLFINDHFNNVNNILCYDVKSQTFQSPIKKCFTNQWDDFIVFNDSLILGSLYDMDAESNPYAIFFQDFKGNFTSGIKSKRKSITNQNQKELLQRMFFYYGDHKIHVKYYYDDTLFVLDNNNLTPYLITKYNSPQSNPPDMHLKIGEKRSYFERYENSSFIIFRNQTFKGYIPFNEGAKAGYERNYFLLNKSNGNYGVIKSYTDDFIDKIQTSKNETMNFPTSLPNNKLYVLYKPLELLHNKSLELTRLRFSDNLNTQLNKIKSSLHETDNPVLLIGIPKKRIKGKT